MEEYSFDNLCDGYDPLPTILPAVKRIIVMGDIHGDWDLTIRLFKSAALINKHNDWIGNDTVVIQVGDQVDRCRPIDKKCHEVGATNNDENSDIKIMEYFTKLHRQALAVGGAVYSLVGNHELLNVHGQINYVSLEGLRGFINYKDPETGIVYKDGAEGRKAAFRPGGQYAKFIGCTRQGAMIIGSNLFVHAGILPEYARLMHITDKSDLENINKLLRLWLLGKINTENVADIVSSQKISMFWTRIFGSIPPNVDSLHPSCEKYVKTILKTFKIGHIYVGHTPQFHQNQMGINSTCNDSVWRVDHGASHAFSGFDDKGQHEPMKERRPQVLEILNDSIFTILTDDCDFRDGSLDL